MSMSSTSLIRSGYPSDWSEQPPPATRPRRRESSGFSRFVLSVAIGVAATLAWQSYGDTARQVIAGSYPQLGWLAPRAAAAQTAEGAASLAGATDQEIKALNLGLAAMRQRVDQLAAQIAAGQDQMTRDISARVQAAQRDILDRIATAQPKPDTQVRKPPVSATSSLR
jgi:small-conductance mechanosensitive channel